MWSQCGQKNSLPDVSDVRSTRVAWQFGHVIGCTVTDILSTDYCLQSIPKWHPCCEDKPTKRNSSVKLERRLAHIDQEILDDDVFEHVIKGIRLSVLFALVRELSEAPPFPRLKEFPRTDTRHLSSVS